MSIRQIMNDTQNYCLHFLTSQEGINIAYSQNNGEYKVKWVKVFGQGITPTDKIRVIQIVEGVTKNECDLEYVNDCFAGVISKSDEATGYRWDMPNKCAIITHTKYFKVELAVVINGHWLIDSWNGTPNFLLRASYTT